MEYLEIGSIQFASTMHHSDEDMDVCVTDDDKDVPGSYNHDDSDTDDPDADFDGDDGDEEDDELIALYRREGRKCTAEEFHREYIYGSSMDQKTVVCPRGTCSWMDKSSGIVWVGVHGTNSICVVTRTGDLDVTRVLGFSKHLTVAAVLRRFRRTIISELEDLASPSRKLSRKLREIFNQSISKPFGVVSVILGTDKVHKESGHEASSDEYEEDKVMKVMPEKVESGKISSAEMKDSVRKFLWGESKSRPHSLPTIAGNDKKKTIKFLQEQMGRETAFSINVTTQASSTEYDVAEATKFLLEKMEASTVDETVKTAISAFQALFQNKFKAKEIEVSVMDPDYFVLAEESGYKDIYVKHLEMGDIEEHLAAINEPGSGGSTITIESKC